MHIENLHTLLYFGLYFQAQRWYIKISIRSINKFFSALSLILPLSGLALGFFILFSYFDISFDMFKHKIGMNQTVLPRLDNKQKTKSPTAKQPSPINAENKKPANIKKNKKNKIQEPVYDGVIVRLFPPTVMAGSDQKLRQENKEIFDQLFQELKEEHGGQAVIKPGVKPGGKVKRQILGRYIALGQRRSLNISVVNVEDGTVMWEQTRLFDKDNSSAIVKQIKNDMLRVKEIWKKN